MALSSTRPTRLHARVRRTLRIFTGRPRLLLAAAAGIGAALLLPEWRLPTRLLGAYDIAVGLHIVLVWSMMAVSTHPDLQRRADQEDVGAVVVLVLTIGAALASLVAIGAELHGIKDLQAGKGPRLALAGGTILLS